MIQTLGRLFRWRLALLNGISALAGSFLYPANLTPLTLAAAFFGVSCLAAGGSALNQVWERELDSRMVRTRRRPLPQGLISPALATTVAALAIGTGLLVLARACGRSALLLGLAALAWYLLVYTGLKRRTPFALLLGALCGALPPMIGWCAAGGGASDYRIVLLAGLLFLWQIPHFWLLQRRHRDDYRAAGVPLLDTATRPGLFWLWLLALPTAALLLPAFGLISGSKVLWYASFPAPLLLLALRRAEKPLFIYLNFFPILLTLLLALP